jgi:hypothetical protein
MIFIANAAIAAEYGILFLVATKPLLAVYAIAPTREAVYMVRWFGVGLLAIGMITWFARVNDEILAILLFEFGRLRCDITFDNRRITPTAF